MTKATTILLLMLIIALSFRLIQGFSVDRKCGQLSSAKCLFSTPRQPRRNLKKRRSGRDGNQKGEEDSDFPWETAESRPIVASKSKEYGEDYWIDEQDLQQAQLRAQAVKNRLALEGEMPKDKLWTEIFAPYKQNWIGVFSVVIIILATIVTNFPELLNQPVIQIPDL